MPTINDVTVVASAYDTVGNGGRKLVQLSNGWLVAGAKDSSVSYTRLYVSKDNGTTFSYLGFIQFSGLDFAMVANGTKVYCIAVNASSGVMSSVIDVPNTSTGANISNPTFETSQTAMGNVSLAINAAGTELHATWSSKNATYPNSFNIRYAKGTIAGDGSVTWGAVEQLTAETASTENFSTPSIVLDKNSIPHIATIMGSNGGYSYLFDITKAFTTKDVGSVASAWGAKFIYNGSTYTQGKPSAIFVPTAVNGLANGRIWVTWHGLDATDTTYENIRVSYSDDGGATWSAMQKLTSGNTIPMTYPSITVNKNNKVFVLFHNNTSGGIRQISYDGTWSTITDITGSTNIPVSASSLLDLTLDFTQPLFIYKNSAKVGFYGTWTVTTISVTQGSIGTKINADKSSLLTYVVTTDGTMSTITEKVNGTVIGTKTATSGQSLIAGLTQAQWDAIKFGKYKDVTGGSNTLTVEMGSYKWTYTFDKRLATTDDIASAIKSVQDSQNTYLPSVKAKLASAVRAKGGTVNDTDPWDTMVSAIANDTRKKWATGKVIPTATSYGKIVVSGLNFQPSIVVARMDSGYDTVIFYKTSVMIDTSKYGGSAIVYTGSGNNDNYVDTTHIINSSGFEIGVANGATNFIWVAIE